MGIEPSCCSKSIGLTKARGSDLCMRLSTQSTDSTKKARTLFPIPPHVSSGSPHFRPQGPLPNFSHHHLGGLAFEHCGACSCHTHPDSPERGSPSRTEGRCEGVGIEGKKWALTSMILNSWVRREENYCPLPLARARERWGKNPGTKTGHAGFVMFEVKDW